jgi:hypothetical protein
MLAPEGEPQTCVNYLPGLPAEDRIWRAVIGALRETNLQEALAQLQEEPLRQRRHWADAIKQMTLQREKLERALRAQQRLLESGDYTFREYEIARGDLLPQLEELDKSLAAAQARLAAVKGPPPIDVSAAERTLARIAEGSLGASREQRAQVLGYLLTRVDVYADHFQVEGILGDLRVPRTTGLPTARRSSIAVCQSHAATSTRSAP